jgi:hypothetical protein
MRHGGEAYGPSGLLATYLPAGLIQALRAWRDELGRPKRSFENLGVAWIKRRGIDFEDCITQGCGFPVSVGLIRLV